MDLELNDKIAVITGGSVGIGLAVAQALAREGVHVLLCAREEARVVEAARAIQAENGVRAVGIQADVSKAADVDRVIRQVDTHSTKEIATNRPNLFTHYLAHPLFQIAIKGRTSCHRDRKTG